MIQLASTLDAIGLSLGTDKSSWGHDYLRFYEPYFQPVRYDKVKILEIGLANGASLKVWEEYFPNADIFGADINPAVSRLGRPRVDIEIVDQASASELTDLGERRGPFDIVIDDGSHMSDHQIITLTSLFPFVRSGGIYIIEDLQTSFGDMKASFRGTATMSCVEYLKQLLDLRVADAQIDIAMEPDEFLRTYARKMDYLIFYRESCLIRKKGADVGDAAIVTVADDTARGLVSMMGHIGGYGDRMSDLPYVTGRSDNQNIQGFGIFWAGRSELSYRAKLHDGTWTDWAGAGAFAGTRGEGSDLTGLAIRLTGEDERIYRIEVVGAFRGEAGHVVVGNGEDCISKTGFGRLWGVQVVLHRR